jgi:hypothetical protein|tara:strand:- start:4801 stop:6987 length:2187 start_codon:yes stop_codon:yes gene_type:complete
MATPQLSPGVLIREVDLTVGRAENVLDNLGAIAGPFSIGPINEPIEISTEQQFINTFGTPISTDRQYEYWMAAEAFLSYGGILKVVRVGGGALNNANAGVGLAATTTLRIDNLDDYEENHETDNSFYWAARSAGTWGNGAKVCVIDNLADQTIGVSTTNLGSVGAIVGHGVTATLSGVSVPGLGEVDTFNGHLKGIIVGVRTDTVNGASKIDVRVLSRVSSAGTESNIEYAEGNTAAAFAESTTLNFVNNSGINTGTSQAIVTAEDWYDQQTLGLTNSTVYWKTLAPRPIDSNYANTHSSRNDTLHIVIVDDDGDITGIQGSIIERHLNLSKALDGAADGEGQSKTYYKDYVAYNSAYAWAGQSPVVSFDAVQNTGPIASGFSTAFIPVTTGDGLWGLNAQGVQFSGLGNITYALSGGVDYQDGGGMTAQLADLITGYGFFDNKDEIEIDFLIMGPGLANKSESQAKANYLISIANARKDCIATISPHKADIVNVSNSLTQTNNLISYYSAISSSSFAVLDTGYKYTFDRFNNVFRYIPTNGDVAGLMVRTSIVAYPWFSPAGQQRGVLNNANKLAYNPNKAQRDQLYPQRINSLINQKGSGIILFGDKTALGYASAFDRINVRRLFLTVEQALEGAANAQLFELNDVNTRSNFVNIVEPFLRDVQAKRGIFDFLVVCDETNNTPDVIDNNEFRADIYLKPSKSINYVTLTFVATRTGVAFEEVVGTV